MFKKKILFLFFLTVLINISSSGQQTDYRLIYIINGDGNYLYHDNKGNAINAAERILGQAKYVAENISRGEVFIFYQEPASNFLFFAKDDGRFIYYKDGKEKSNESYSRKSFNKFEAESEFINSYSESTKNKINILLYYGHEIPSYDSAGYYESYPEKDFGLNVFSKGIKNIIDALTLKSNKLDLIVLSTCKNGNEKTLSYLNNLTDYLVASPKDIHLSYMNSESLISLSNSGVINPENIAKEFSRSAFNQMIGLTRTEVSINVYRLTNGVRTIKHFYRLPEFGIKKAEIK